ncbi:MAG: PTS system mannose/fructose/sorbose family transporter subunit IID [Desulfovibrionaceae bacterium]|nr:PTS system mannose/fructose/sorbose family transporter subunit IID [Desulfovibrionaceae bacterium]
MLSTRATCSCLLRTWFVNAANSTRGMQEIGLLFVLEPGLRELYPEEERLAAALGRYAEHANTHPFLLPLFAGMLLSLEEQAAAGLLPESLLKTFKNATAPTLSALGDAFFSGTLLPMWAIGTTLLILQGWTTAALALAALAVCALTAFRAAIFFLGLRQNMRALQWLRRLDLVNWAGRLKSVNAVLLAVLFWRLLPPGLETAWPLLLTGAALLAGAAWGVGRLQLSRLALFTAALLTLMLTGRFL